MTDSGILQDLVFTDVAAILSNLVASQNLFFDSYCASGYESEFSFGYRRILRLEATTTLLEAKLDSVARSRSEAGSIFFLELFRRILMCNSRIGCIA